MDETLISSSEPLPVDSAEFQDFLSRTTDRLSQLRSSVNDHLDQGLTPLESQKFLEDFLADARWNRCQEIQEEDPCVDALVSEDLEVYLDLFKELRSLQEENEQLSHEIMSLTDIVVKDSARMDVDLKELDSDINKFRSRSPRQEQLYNNENCMFNHVDIQAMELNCLISKRDTVDTCLMSSANLNQYLKREDLNRVEELFCGVRVIEFDANSVRLSMKSYAADMDNILLKQKLGSLKETFDHDHDHEIVIEFGNELTQLKNVKISSTNVCLDHIVYTAKSSRHSLPWLVWNIQQQILLCTLRLLVVDNINNSRRSAMYSDKDETITIHLVDGVDAYIEIPDGWPISDFGLKLISVTGKSNNTISLDIICKINDSVDALDKQTLHCLEGFVDTIEHAVHEMKQNSQ
ncbi:hypothetical protein ZOSMA_74G00870 [Zostera marina]|uniref:Uncharacterized protein n=1 Tax=Zostera marina TaxID=29655 RepID=A0A0K9NQ59_ZOSMR|nr:hypothetical protein ZOSMA_74G00870 [Zostera marina]